MRWANSAHSPAARGAGRLIASCWALALDPSNTDAAGELGFDYMLRGEFDKSLEYLDKAIRGSPHEPAQVHWYGGQAEDNFGLKRYDQAIELARKSDQFELHPGGARGPCGGACLGGS